ncbi:flippase [Metabacillus arenae]|nr:flippase [Metabacillus arenae]
MTSSNKQFARNSMITLTRQLASILIGFLLIIIIAKVLGPEAQGKYTLITMVPLMLQTFMNLGINSSTIYYVSKKEVDLNTAFNTNVLTGFLLSLLSVGIGSVVIILLSSTTFKEVNTDILYLALLALPFMFLMIFLQTIFQGLQNFKMFNSILVIQQTSNLLMVTIFLIVFDLGLKGAIFAFIIGYLISVSFVLYVIFYKYKMRLNLTFFSKPYFKKSLNYGFKTHISNVMTFLNYRLDIFLIGYFINPFAVGVYSVAVSIGERLSVFSQSISTVLLPRVASLNNEEERNYISSIVSRNMLIFITILSVIVFFLSNFIFTVIIDKDYSESALILQILLPGLAVLSIEKLLSNDLAARGKPEINMYVAFVNVGLNLILNLILIPAIGIKGAAIASTVTYLVSFIIKVIIFSKITKQPIVNFLIIKKQDFLLYKRILANFSKKIKPSNS